jgi:two-component system sensor histidine kinase TctE
MNDALKATGSIRRRLTVQLLSGAAILTIILVFIVRSFSQQLAEQSQDNILNASLTAILDASSIQQGEVTVDIPYSAFSMLSNLSNDRVFYRIDQDGAFLTGYADLPTTKLRAAADTPTFMTGTYQDVEIRMVTATRLLALEGRPIELQASIAQSRNGQAQTLAEISNMVMLFGSGFFVMSAIIALLAAQSTVGPLQRLAASVSRRGPHDLRPVTATVPEEMVPLVQSLNQFIQRLDTSLTRSEDFIAEAAHRVRTPLATVRAQAEITLRRVDKDENRAALKEMIRAIDDSSRAAGQLLDHAMVTFRTDHLERSRIDLAALVRECVDRLQAVAALKDMALTYAEIDTAQISGDAILIQNAVRNLLDNAIKYSPMESHISIELTVEAPWLTLSIYDQGLGFPKTGAERLTERFERGDNVGGIVGSGLGLTIVDEVIHAHGGNLTISNNPNGVGACVSISFPLP